MFNLPLKVLFQLNIYFIPIFWAGFQLSYSARDFQAYFWMIGIFVILNGCTLSLSMSSIVIASFTGSPHSIVTSSVLSIVLLLSALSSTTSVLPQATNSKDKKARIPHIFNLYDTFIVD